MRRYTKAARGRRQRPARKHAGLSGRRGLGVRFSPNISDREIEGVISEVNSFVNDANTVPRRPKGEIEEARDYIDSLQGFASSLSSLQGSLSSILRGRYTQSVKETALSLYSDVNNLLDQMDSEIVRAQNFIQQYDSFDERVAPTLNAPSGPSLQALSV